MSSSHRPAAPLAFSAEVLAASTVIATCGACNTSRDMLAEVTSFLMEGIYLTAEATGILAIEAAKGLNMIREEGTQVGQQIGKETFDFLSGGATMGASMIGDISQGAKGELIHGVKEGGRLFSMMVGGAEVMFERCGTAIVGRFVDEEQEAIDRELTQRIADAYQMIMKQVGEISVGKESTNGRSY